MRSGGWSSWPRRTPRDTLEQQKAEWLADDEKTGEALSSFRRRSSCPGRRAGSSATTSRHVQGTNQVASMVVFEDGTLEALRVPSVQDQARCRATTTSPDMQEVMRRRFTRALADQGLAERVADDDEFDEQPTEAAGAEDAESRPDWMPRPTRPGPRFPIW